MSAQHTPGPWHLVMSDNATPFIMHESGSDLTDLSDLSSLVCHMPAEISRNFNSLENARLIAAAPELLEALVAVMHSKTESALSMARKAIAKAEGKQ